MDVTCVYELLVGARTSLSSMAVAQKKHFNILASRMALGYATVATPIPLSCSRASRLATRLAACGNVPLCSTYGLGLQPGVMGGCLAPLPSGTDAPPEGPGSHPQARPFGMC